MFMRYCMKQSPSKHKKSIDTSLMIVGVFAIVMQLSLLFQIACISSAHALSYDFNCIIRWANKSGGPHANKCGGARSSQALNNNIK